MRTSRCTPDLGFQPAIGARALDQQGRRLDPRLFPGVIFEDLGLAAVALGPARVHAQEHLGPVLALGTAGAGMDLKIAVVAVGFAGQHGLDLPPLDLVLDGAERAFGLDGDRQVVFGLGELDHADIVGELALEALDRVDLVGELLALAHQLLGTLGRIPEVGQFGEGVQFREADLGVVVVKDASSAG